MTKPLCTCPDRPDPDWSGNHLDDCPWAIYLAKQSVASEKQRGLLAQEVARVRNRCGSLLYTAEIPTRICLLPPHDDDKHDYNGDDNLIRKVIPF